MWSEALVIAAVVIGTFFMVVASFGVLRLPDFYARVHAPTKAATLGLAFLLVAFSIHVAAGAAVTKALLCVLFVGITAPVSGHVLARAAYRCGVRPPQGIRVDEYCGVEPAGEKEES